MLRAAEIDIMLASVENRRRGTMIIPIRCFTCGKPIAHMWEAFEHVVKVQKEAADGIDDAPEKSAKLVALETLHIDRMCCRRHFMTNLDIVDRL